MCSPNSEPDPDVGVGDYYKNRKPKRATGRLVALAPHVLVIAYCEGAPEAALYFAERLECKVTERMIKTIKAKVAKKIVHVTREDLEEAACSHPITAARMAREPAMCDPQHYRADIPSEPAQEKIKTSNRKDSVKKKPVGKPTEEPNPTEKENQKKTAEASTGTDTKSDSKHLTDEEMREAEALLAADDADDEDLYS